MTDLRAAARELHQRFGCAALVKGGHLRGLREAVDIFYDGRQELLLSAPFIRGVSTHGTGCTYSAAIAGLPGAGLLVAAGGATGQGIHHSSHRAEPNRRRAQRPQLLLAVIR